MTLPAKKPLNRRQFFATTGAAALTAGSATSANAASPASENVGLDYEIKRTDAEWREMLTEYEYYILREGLTEKPKTSPLWEATAPGTYHCRGCELKSYDGNFKVVLDKGWVFFYHAEGDAVLLGVDGNVPEYGSMTAGHAAITEVHCRRCASHLGHIIVINKIMTHCINGTALTFQPAAT